MDNTIRSQTLYPKTIQQPQSSNPNTIKKKRTPKDIKNTNNKFNLKMNPTNTKYNDSKNNPENNYGFTKKTRNALKKLNTPEMKRKTRGKIMKMKNIKFYKNNYLRPCKKGEDPYYPYPPKQKQRPMTGKSKKISFKNPKDYSKFGFIIKLDEDIESGIMVPANRKKRCYTSKSSIKDKSVKQGKLCYKDSHCEIGKCSGALLGLAEGKCKVPRKRTNLGEGVKCKASHECKSGLKCKGNLGGLKLGKCMKEKTNKNNKKSRLNPRLNLRLNPRYRSRLMSNRRLNPRYRSRSMSNRRLNPRLNPRYRSRSMSNRRLNPRLNLRLNPRYRSRSMSNLRLNPRLNPRYRSRSMSNRRMYPRLNSRYRIR